MDEAFTTFSENESVNNDVLNPKLFKIEFTRDDPNGPSVSLEEEIQQNPVKIKLFLSFGVFNINSEDFLRLFGWNNEEIPRFPGSVKIMFSIWEILLFMEIIFL